ncbi:unnamed protein product [Adineta ricciae]|uniref:Uncharacterized protein n=1 Tax=Adineta ricciae TaxID=249248 RepID=A0A814WHQ1_ADIRI|nr:unnamed protein product [Adineta ricciae]
MKHITYRSSLMINYSESISIRKCSQRRKHQTSQLTNYFSIQSVLPLAYTVHPYTGMDMNLYLGSNGIPYGQPTTRTGMVHLNNIPPQLYGFHYDPLPNIGVNAPYVRYHRLPNSGLPN